VLNPKKLSISLSLSLSLSLTLSLVGPITVVCRGSWLFVGVRGCSSGVVTVLWGSSLFIAACNAGVLGDFSYERQYSVFGSILIIGAVIGAILSGKIVDHFGRRGAMAFSELLCIVGCFTIVFAKAKNLRWEYYEDVWKYLRGQHVDTSAEADEIRMISLFLFDMLFHILTLKFHKIW
ncbi:Sugar transporter ERD6-like 5, partial [Bienertia sinuspersici]